MKNPILRHQKSYISIFPLNHPYSHLKRMIVNKANMSKTMIGRNNQSSKLYASAHHQVSKDIEA